MSQPFSLSESVSILASTPTTVRQIVETLPHDWHASNYAPSTFSPRDIISHYVHNEHTDWIPRLTSILESDSPPSFAPFVVQGHIALNEGKSVEELLDEFESERTRSLLTLEEWHLSDEQLAKIGIHPTLGNVTIQHLIATWVVHDLHHISQLCKCTARQWIDEVGPFCDYIGILKKAV